MLYSSLTLVGLLDTTLKSSGISLSASLILFTNRTSRSKYPHVPGRLVLQDLPPVIDSIQQLHPKIERMKHDFLTEQPVKGTSKDYETNHTS